MRGRKGNLARSGRLVKKANQALPDPLVLRARPVLRARKVLLFLQARPRTPFELYACRGECNQNAVLVIGYCGPRRIPVTLINERTVTCPRIAGTSPLVMVCAKAAS